MFPPGSVVRRVNSEAVLLLGGGRALLLQVAHPKVAAGVAQHSNYREDPWGRLYRTLQVTLRIVFGDAESSADAVEQLRRRHSRVSGEDDRGEPYEALDPALLLWVHATLIDTSLLLYERYVRPLDPGERRAYYEEMRVLGEAYGIPRERQPADYSRFRSYFDAMVAGPELRATPTLHDVAVSVLRPPVPLPARPVASLLNLVTVGTLPQRLRDELGLDWGPRRERLLGASAAAVRATLPRLPAVVRTFPQSRR